MGVTGHRRSQEFLCWGPDNRDAKGVEEAGYGEECSLMGRGVPLLSRLGVWTLEERCNSSSSGVLGEPRLNTSFGVFRA